VAENIFRQAALERLSSPEQLDRLVTVASPKAWIALFMLGMIIAAAVVWGILGTIPTRVEGQGILISNGGRVVNVQAAGSGFLTEINVTVGHPVEAGQIVARLSQTDAQKSYENAQAILQERLDNQTRTHAQVQHEQTLKMQHIERQRQTLRDSLAAGYQRMEFLQERQKQDQALLTKKIITRDMVDQTRQEAHQTNREIVDLRKSLAYLDNEELDLLTTLEQRRRTAEEAVNEARRQVAQIEVTLAQATMVTAPASGIVTEVKVSPGALVTQGQSLFTFQSGGESLDLILYIPPQYGKRVKPGMAAQVAPVTAKREEFGTINGQVKWISEFPATVEGMRAVLQNDELVRTFTQNGPPYVARISLYPDPETVSGYRWSSAKGATLGLSSGTLASAEMTVSEQAPVTLIIPLLREYTGIY